MRGLIGFWVQIVNTTFFLLGPSDIEGRNLTIPDRSENGKVRYAWAGLLPIKDFVMGDPTLRAKSRIVLLGMSKPLEVRKNARLNLFNLVGDADASVGMLNTVQDMENSIQARRFFNRTENVFKTSRERLPKTLSNIPGCRVPRVKASDPRSFSELEAACEEFDAWPLIIRARGYHAGQHMRLVENKSQLDAIKDSPWLYGGIFLIEFVDYRSADGMCRKTRVVLVDGVPYPRHSIISDRWLIHPESRGELMDRDIELCRQEQRFLHNLGDRGLKEYGTVFKAIYERIGLDIFGVDFTILDGQILIFEANACMNFLGPQDYGKDGRYKYLESYIKDLKRAVKKMLIQA